MKGLGRRKWVFFGGSCSGGAWRSGGKGLSDCQVLVLLGLLLCKIWKKAIMVGVGPETIWVIPCKNKKKKGERQKVTFL